MTGRSKKIRERIRQIGKILRAFIAGKKIKKRETASKASEASWENPYIDDFRQILLQVLEQRDRSFRDLKPVVIDTDCPDQSFLTADDTDRLLEVLAEGLNYLEIRTDRPEHFHGFVRRMYEESGLPVLLYPKAQRVKTEGNLILDLERKGKPDPENYPHSALYIPVQKKVWRGTVQTETKNAGKTGQESGNLDIAVPIGYNIVTVKISRQNHSDRI